MPRVQAQSVEDFAPEVPLNAGWYAGEIIDIQSGVYGGQSKLIVRMYVKDEPAEQEDGTSAIGRTITDFLTISGYESFKDGGKFAKQKRFRFAKATGHEEVLTSDFDTDDLIGVELLFHAKPNLNPKTDEWVDQVTDYRPLD